MLRDTIIKDALVLLGKKDPAIALTSTETTEGAKKLNEMLREWSGLGFAVWKRASGSFSLTQAQASFTIGPSGADVTASRPVDVLFAAAKDSNGQRVPLLPMSEHDYEALEDQALPGIPRRYRYQLTDTASAATNTAKGTITVHPVTNAANWTLEYRAITAFTAFSEAVDDAAGDPENTEDDFPAEYQGCLVQGLAGRWAKAFGFPDAECDRLTTIALQTAQTLSERGLRK